MSKAIAPHLSQGLLLFTLSSAALYLVAKTKDVRRRKGDSSIPPSSPKSIDNSPPPPSVSSLKGTVKAIDMHVIVCGMGAASTWPKRLEDDKQSVLSRLSQLLEDFNGGGKRIKVTGCDLPNTLQGFTDIIVYPDARVYRVDDESMVSLAVLLSDSSSAKSKVLSPTPWPKSVFKDEPVSFEHLVLVCAHANRDKRCGRAGPAIIEAITAEVSKSGKSIKVAASSHIGGHEFAGTCAIYPQGDWYGHLTVKGSALSEVISSLLHGGGIVERCHRGCSFDW